MKGKWKRVFGQFIILVPFMFITVTSIYMGLSVSFAGWVELYGFAEAIDKAASADRLIFLSLINQSALLITSGSTLALLGFLATLYCLPKAEAWLDRNFPKETTAK